MDRIGIVHRLFENRWFYSLKSKLILSFLAISIIPLAAVVTLAYLQFQEALRSQASNQLVVVRDLKVKQVRSYLRRIEQDINLVAQLPYVKTAMQQLEIGVRGQGLNQVRQMGFLGRPDLFYLAAYHPYAVYHAKYHAFFRELVQTKGYADIWLVSPEGDIIYTFAKRDDFATNLLQAPNQDTPPVRLFQNLLANAETGRVQMTDYGVYPPAGDIPVSFIGAPILDEDKLVGCLIYQLSLGQINNLMQIHAGFWKTGETYLVGTDYLARTRTLFGKKNHFFEQRVDSLAVRKGLMGESGVAIIEDYRGMPVLSAYQPIAMDRFKWVLLAEVDQSEAFGPSNRLRKLMVGIVLVTTLLVIGVGFYIGRSIAKPIVELAETSTRIASGDLALRARSGTRDEIGLLAEAFNSMTGRLSALIGSLEQQIAERKQAETELKRIEWMLSKKHTVIEGQEKVLDQGYGDLTALNRNGLILKSVGRDVLRSIAADYLDLLGTSTAIYEVNGSYAFGIFTSNWCRMLDLASRKLCDTDDNAGALNSGRWLCHESCWTCCSKETIATRAPVDIACSGGIRLYGVPIVAHETVIGSINFGYGDAPNDPVKLRALASVFHLDYEDLLAAAEAYDSRPPYIIEMAKSRLHASAKLIGIMVERKQAEKALSRLNTELDQRVLERTAELEAANKEMHAFTYTVSHDLRAPLRHIDGFMELLQRKAGQALDEQGRHYMEAVSGAARKMGMLIDDLLAFSRMGRHALSVQPVELGTLVHEVMRELAPDAAGRDIDWRIGDLPAVRGDASLLRMVLVNLITNALKFTRPRQEPQIEIGSIPGKDAETVIFVRDNGVGFDMTYADKLFGVFQRLHRAEEFEGTGIGLATVHRIIDRHGGRIWAEGAPDQGATFFFSLPRSIQEGEAC